MARIQFDPNLLECPDFASLTYAATRVPLVNDNTTEQQAIQFLRDIWITGNEADKVRWQVQSDEDDAVRREQLRIQSEADDLRAQAQVEEAEALGIGTGNPGVFQGYPYPNPSKPVPLGWGTGLSVTGSGFCVKINKYIYIT
jgi:hypothetical protein